MHIKIFTEGGKTIGLGHLSRCISLYDEIIKRGFCVDLIIDGDIDNLELLSGIPFIKKNWRDKEYMTSTLSKKDYVILDSYKAPLDLYFIVAQNSMRALYIDDTCRLNYPAGIILNPSLNGNLIRYLPTPNQRILSGPDYVILRAPFINQKRIHPPHGVSNVLITMGGTDIRSLTPLLIDRLCQRLSHMTFDIVLGDNSLVAKKHLLSAITNLRFHADINANQMMRLMIHSDVAITAAGQTIFELLATQTPFIPIQVIDNQENNIRSLLDYNPDQIIFRYDDKDLLTDLYDILSTPQIYLLQEKNNNYQGLVDGYGVVRIIDELLKGV